MAALLFEVFAAPAAAPVAAAAAGAPPVVAAPPRLITCGVVCAAWSLLPGLTDEHAHAQREQHDAETGERRDRPAAAGVRGGGRVRSRSRVRVSLARCREDVAEREPRVGAPRTAGQAIALVGGQWSAAGRARLPVQPEDRLLVDRRERLGRLMRAHDELPAARTVGGATQLSLPPFGSPMK